MIPKFEERIHSLEGEKLWRRRYKRLILREIEYTHEVLDLIPSVIHALRNAERLETKKNLWKAYRAVKDLSKGLHMLDSIESQIFNIENYEDERDPWEDDKDDDRQMVIELAGKVWAASEVLHSRAEAKSENKSQTPDK